MHTFRRGAYFETVNHDYFVKNQGEFGHHSRDGLYVFAGQDFLAGAAEKVVSMMDLPTTLLDLYGVPIPEDWDGATQRELMVPEWADRPHTVQPGDPVEAPDWNKDFASQDSQDFISRLEALGYM